MDSIQSQNSIVALPKTTNEEKEIVESINVSREDCGLQSLICSSVDNFVTEVSEDLKDKQNEISNSENLDHSKENNLCKSINNVLTEKSTLIQYTEKHDQHLQLNKDNTDVQGILFKCINNNDSVQNEIKHLDKKEPFIFSADHLAKKIKTPQRKKVSFANKVKKNKKRNNVLSQPARPFLSATRHQTIDACKVNETHLTDSQNYIEYLVNNDNYNEEYFFSKQWCKNSASVIESIDNNNPKWINIMNINSDYDKFNFVRSSWHHLNSPNPLTNLTFFNRYPFKASTGNVVDDALNNIYIMDASQYYDCMIQKVINLRAQHFEIALQKNREEYVNLQNKHLLQKNNCHKNSRTINKSCEMINLQLIQNQEKNSLFNKHKERIDYAWSSFNTQLKKLTEASHETKKYYSFYNDTALQHYHNNLFQKVENQLEEYRHFYNIADK